ncbi:hypothetical protein EG832_08620, partial [bacterium]|nr:hypothetical protein [bacterium]
MNNLERFKQAIQWQPIDRILTYDFLDNRQILIDHGGFYSNPSYTFLAVFFLLLPAPQTPRALFFRLLL